MQTVDPYELIILGILSELSEEGVTAFLSEIEPLMNADSDQVYLTVFTLVDMISMLIPHVIGDDSVEEKIKFIRDLREIATRIEDVYTQVAEILEEGQHD